LFDDFVNVFSEALRQGHSAELSRSPQGKLPIDKIIITDIYDVAGREKKSIKEKVSSEKLIRAINNERAGYLPKEKVKNYLKKNLKSGGVVIIMGAGDIYKIADNLSE
jgi:UDP-N-acetylmuramate--alanine ligase